MQAHCKALALTTRLKAKSSEVVKKGDVITALTASNSELEKKLHEAEEALATSEAEKTAVMDEVEGLKKKNEELSSDAQTSEGIRVSLESRIAELEDKLKTASEVAIRDFRASQEYNDEHGEAYMEGFVDAKLVAKKLFPDLDLSELKPVDDTMSIAPEDEEETREVDDAQS